MGGLITKAMLSELNRPNTVDLECLDKVRAVIFLSTPSHGADLAVYASWISMNPQFTDMKPDDLNGFLLTLKIPGRISSGIETKWGLACQNLSAPTKHCLATKGLWLLTDFMHPPGVILIPILLMLVTPKSLDQPQTPTPSSSGFVKGLKRLTTFLHWQGNPDHKQPKLGWEWRATSTR